MRSGFTYLRDANSPANQLFSWARQLVAAVLLILALAVLLFPQLRHTWLRDALKYLFLLNSFYVAVGLRRRGLLTKRADGVMAEIQLNGRVTSGLLEGVAILASLVALIVSAFPLI